MAYHDSIKDAEKLLTLAVKQLRLWNLATSPINYTLSYEYVNSKNHPLIQAIDQHITSGKELDNFIAEELYRQHVLGQSKFRDEIITDVEQVIAAVGVTNKHSSNTLVSFVETLDNNIGDIQSADKKRSSTAILALRKASKKLKQQQGLLNKQLQSSKVLTAKLKAELEETRKEIYLDPLTQFYNRKAMAKHLDVWLNEDPHKSVAAIVINVDHLSQFSQRFGPLISDVLLSKIANKVSTYVGESGLPVRSAGDEFIILLPDLETNIAQEIAMKIGQGVEKLRFVSSKSGIRLPKMSVSVGVGQFKVAEEVNTIIKKARQLLRQQSTHQEAIYI